MTVFKTIEECSVELISHTSKVTHYAHGHSLTAMDNFPARAARVSFANDRSEHTEEQDAKLINYLADHDHLTPFEYQHATVMIECPLFIRSQIHRHRTFSYNEISRRYTSEELEFWMPSTWRVQATDNKQASAGDIDEFNSGRCHEAHEWLVRTAVQTYKAMIAEGVAREQARAILPQSLLTRFYMGGNLRNWAHFLKLREDGHAQYEVRVIAGKIHTILADLWPASLEALMK